MPQTHRLRYIPIFVSSTRTRKKQVKSRLFSVRRMNFSSSALADRDLKNGRLAEKTLLGVDNPFPLRMRKAWVFVAALLVPERAMAAIEMLKPPEYIEKSCFLRIANHSETARLAGRGFQDSATHQIAENLGKILGGDAGLPGNPSAGD
jgi:hypothetical protein